MIKKVSFLVLFIFIIFISCDLFNPGLGDKIDLDPPLLVVSSHVNGEYVSGTITLSGKYVDDIGAKSVEVSLDNGNSYLQAILDTASRTWQLNVDTSGFSDGYRDCVFRVTDTDSKSTESKLLLVFDNTPPTVLVKAPTSLQYDSVNGVYYNTKPYNGNLIISGESADEFLVRRVYVTLGDSLGNIIPIGDSDNYTRRPSKSGSYVEGRSALKSWNQLANIADEAEGTTSWNYIFDSTIDFPDSAGNYFFVVNAMDFAGNTSTYFYHYDVVSDVKDDTEFIADQLRRLEANQSVPELTITKVELESVQLDRIRFSFDQNTDLPEFTIFNPDENAPTIGERILAGTGEIIGQVKDDDGIDESTLKIRIDRELPSATGAWESVPLENINKSGLIANFQFELSAYASFDCTDDGTYTLYYQVEDINHLLFDSSVDGSPLLFKVDNGAPSIEITSPEQNEYINNNFQILGTASDSDSVASVQISTDNGLNYDEADNLTSLGGGLYNWDYNVTVGGDGNLSIKVKAVDASGKTAYYNLQCIIDRTPPLVSFLNPALSSSVNGQILIKGTSSDNNQISKIELKIGGAVPDSDPDALDCDISFDSDEFYNWQYSLDSMAYANTSYATETAPDSNVWQLYIYARVTDQANNTTIKSNYYFYVDSDLDKPTINIIAPSNNQNIGGPVLITGTAFDDDAVHHVEIQMDVNGDGDFLDQIDFYDGVSDVSDGDTNDRFEDETKWYSVSGTTLWSQEINNYGELYSTEAGHTGDITIRVRAVDTKDSMTADLAGNYQTLSIHLDNTIPRIEALSHASSDYVQGTISLTGDALDDEEVASIWFSYNGGTNYTNIISNSSYVTQNAINDYDIHIPINTSSFVPTSGILYLRLKVIDNANYQTISFINLNVDNLYPAGMMTTDTTDIYGDSDNAMMQGTALDSGTVAGVDEIHVYFVRGIDVYRVTDPSPATPPVVTNVEARDFGDGNGSVYWVSDIDYKIVIDNKNEFGVDASGNGDNDEHNESFTLSGSNYNWWAQFDSTLIPDGAIEVHYVVFDSAGNGHHYEKAGFIKNHKPVINDITVGSDIDLSNTVEPDEQFAYSTSFSVRNRLYIDIDANDDSPISDYKVYYDPSGSNTLIQSSATSTIDISSFTDGPAELLVRVTDSDNIVIETTIDMTIENTDSDPPSIALDSLTQNHVLDGHLEVSGTDNYDGIDADVSGTISFTGTVSDDQRIGSMDLSITNHISNLNVATWSGGQLVSTDANFVINTQSLSAANGHDITFTYTWNSANITNAVGTNITISFSVDDFAPQSDSDSITVDVVPYISGLSTNALGVKDGNIRSSSGIYSIKTGNTSNYLTITGYNLNVSTVYISSSPTNYTVGDTLTISTAAASPYSSIKTRNDGSMSGYVTVVSASGVPSLNNFNNNTVADNQEPDSFSKNDLWTDDRYLRFFTVTNTGYINGYYPEMIMEGDVPMFGYIDDSANEDLGVRRGNGSTDTPISRGLAWHQHAMARDADGLYYQLSTHNFNYGHLILFYDTYASDYASNNGAADPYWSSYSGNFTQSDGNDAMNLDYTYYTPGFNLNRFLSPQLEVKGRSTGTGNEASVYMAFYDAPAGDLIFRNFQIGQGASGGSNLSGTINSNLDETYRLTSGDATRKTISSNSSEFFDMGVTDQNYVIVIYFDDSASQLYMVYSTTTAGGSTPQAIDGSNPTATRYWSTPIALDTSYVGTYARMYIETDGNSGTADPIHITAYDSGNADLRYIYLSDYADTTPQAVTVDSHLSVGIWNDIKVNSAGVPYISYYNNSLNGTPDSIKLAWYNGDVSSSVNAGVDANNYVSGEWEFMTVPVNQVPQGGITKFQRVNLGFNSSNLPVLGYLADDIEYVVLVP
ncbi:MAG: hypothetical protein JXR70_00025 [Spirochaetales bacterium]|nr:hypothetical protein [Spirochaetales bacterium]